MKKIVAMLLICILSFIVVPTQAKTYDDNMRAVWISTVYNLDYPSTKNNIAAQQSEFIQKLDALKAIGMNTVIVQVRPKADALYASSINPWSDVLTGTQGKNPGYDPLAFMIKAAHERGMELHAWLNPYRVTTSGTDLNNLCATHPARLNPTWTFNYNNAIYYNPEVEGVKQHIVDTVKEIVTNYNVDGIHFDDYFYPSYYPLPAGETKDGSVANARREAINDMVKRVGSTIKTANATYGKSVKFGISPPGIWKNKSSDATGSNTSGREAYYAVFADTRTWIKNEWIDYIVPQIYWKIGHSKADYETLVKWWSNEVAGTNVKLYIGQGIYTDDVASEMGKQLQVNQKYANVKGSMYFSLKDLLNNRKDCKTQIAHFYKNQTNIGSGSIINGTTSGNNQSISGATTGSSNISNGITSESGNNTENWFDSPSNSTIGGTTSGGSTSNNSTPSSSTINNSSATQLQANVGKIGTVKAETLNVRAGASTSREVVAQVRLGDKVTILSVLNDWYKVKLADGKIGWVNSSYITISNESSSQSSTSSNTSSNTSKTYPVSGKVTATTLNVRAGARTDREVIATITNGTNLTVLGEMGDWYKVKLANGKIGWVVKSYISTGSSVVADSSTTASVATFPRTGSVTASSLNIRSGAKTDREVIATVSAGTKLTLLSSMGDWYKVKLSNGTIGWATKIYIS